jgi:hypothetical protein
VNVTFTRWIVVLTACLVSCALSWNVAAGQSRDGAQGRNASLAEAAAHLEAAAALHTTGSRADAVRRYEELVARYPDIPVSGAARLYLARERVAAGDAGAAMELLQQVRDRFPGTADATAALQQLTTIHRLYLRLAAAPLFVPARTIAGQGGKFRDFRDIAVDAAGHLFVATKDAITEFGADGRVVRTWASADNRAILLDPRGQVLTLHDQGAVRGEGRSTLTLATARSNGRLDAIEIDAAAVTPNGDLIVANRSQRTLVRFAADGRPQGELAKGISARRLAVSATDDMAALDADGRVVSLLGRDGQLLARIAERGADYQIRQATDVAFDALGHLYVLDRSAVHVFAPRSGRHLASFAPSERSPGAFSNGESLAVDPAGRVYVYEGRADVVQVYR